MSFNFLAQKRIMRDIKTYKEGELDKVGIYCDFDDSDIQSVKALIIGPKDTPYENGFYLFAGIPQQPITIEQQMSNNTDVITINRTGANTNPAAGCSPDGSWYFSTISFADVQNKFLSNGCEMSGCDAGSQSVGFGLGAVDFSIVEII